MTNGELIQALTQHAVNYCAEACASLARNNHMNELTEVTRPTQKQIEAVVVDFVNHVGVHLCGLDVALYTVDIKP